MSIEIIIGTIVATVVSAIIMFIGKLIGKIVIKQIKLFINDKLKKRNISNCLKEQEKIKREYYDNYIIEVSDILNEFKKRWNDDTPQQKERIAFIKKISKYDKTEYEGELNLEQINNLIFMKKDLFFLYENFPKGFASSKSEKRLIDHMKKHLEENYFEEE